MRTLPTEMIRLLSAFVPLFSRRVWPHVQVLLIVAILAPGKRTVSSALHAMGLSQEERFHRYHRVLSRASWSSVKASRVLLGLLVEIPWAARGVWALPFLSARALCRQAGQAPPEDTRVGLAAALVAKALVPGT